MLTQINKYSFKEVTKIIVQTDLFECHVIVSL
jgi:hypothetical protein